jgi:hypothetical protein
MRYTHTSITDACRDTTLYAAKASMRMRMGITFILWATKKGQNSRSCGSSTLHATIIAHTQHQATGRGLDNVGRMGDTIAVPPCREARESRYSSAARHLKKVAEATPLMSSVQPIQRAAFLFSPWRRGRGTREPQGVETIDQAPYPGQGSPRNQGQNLLPLPSTRRGVGGKIVPGSSVFP